MNRFTRKLVCLVGSVAIVFAQLAVTAHACPMQFVGIDAAAVTRAAEADAGFDDVESSALCQQHCEHAQQSINDTPQPLAFVSLAPAFVVTLLLESATPPLAIAPTRTLLHATSPPHAIRNCCFRI